MRQMWQTKPFQMERSPPKELNANDSGISLSSGSRNSLVLSSSRMEDDSCEPLVHFRNRSMAQKARLSNRHSYHAGVNSTAAMVGIPPERFSYNPLNAFYLPIAHTVAGNSAILQSQHSLEDFDVTRPPSNNNNKRYSANFALNVVREDCHNMNSVNSSDSLSSRPTVDTMQQGPDLQDSPRSSNVSGPTTKREDLGKNQMQPMIPQGSIPIQGQVLIDPTTGQHYIVPQAAFYQPVQPMYYPQNTNQIYYPAPYGQPPPQGYPVMPSGGQPGYGAVPVSHANYLQQQQQRYSAGQQMRYAANSATGEENPAAARSYEERKYDQIPPQSPTLSMHSNHFPCSVSPYGQQQQVAAFNHQQRQQPAQYPYVVANSSRSRGSPSSQPEDPENSRDSFRRDASRSSAEFSARSSGEFRRQMSGAAEFERQGSGEFQLNRGREGGDSQRSAGSIERTPLYGGPPQWWGRGREEGDNMTDVDSRHTLRTSPPTSTFAASDSEAMRQQQSFNPAPRAPPSRPVRMDIDFSKPMGEEMERKPKESPTTVPSLTPVSSRSAIRLDFDFSITMPEELELLEKAKAAPRVPATAFTVTFDSPSDAVSLQDAARKSAQARRVLNRRSGATGNTCVSNSDGIPGEQSNKKCLLSKLLNGSSGSSEVGSDVPDICEMRDHDMISEAGTFVVDTSARGSKVPTQKRIIEDSDSETESESETESGPSRDPSPVRPPPQPTKNNNDMLKGLCQIRPIIGIKPPTSIRAAAPAPSVPIRPSRGPLDVRPATSSVLPSLAKRSSIGMPCSPAVASTTGNGAANRSVTTRIAPSSPSTTPANNFRRGDGGRFSMRGAAQSTVGSVANKQTRPPFRAGGAPVRPASGTPQQQREQEMTAWLRRKDYNPMKAAAQAKKAKEVKTRGDQFVSNRSISFHIGPAAGPRRQNEMIELSRNRSEESLAAEEAEQASQRIVAEYSRGVVKDINRLSQQTRSTGKQLSGVSRAVDMLSQKCKKSIELIRSQNKGCLSVSVEDLLSAAAEPPRADESLDEQLERLSDAFDAVQIYLEQYSLDGHQSPIPEFNEEAETTSMVSGFSGFSIRSREPQAQEKNTRSTIGSTSSPMDTPRSTIGYRSKILAGTSSPTRNVAPQQPASTYDEDETY